MYFYVFATYVFYWIFIQELLINTYYSNINENQG